jgi:hypothetical protein
VRRLTSLLGRKVVTESGLALGRCYDLLGVGGHDRHDEVAWSSIVRFERDRIVVRDP